MSNFDFLNERFSELSKLGELAEKNIYIDSSTSLVKLRIFGEYIVKYIIKLEGLDKRAPGSKGKQFNRIKILKKNELLPQEIEDILQILRKKGNPAAHEVYENIEDAKESLRLAYELAVWFMKVYVDDQFICKEFVMPESQLIQSDLKKIEQEYKVQVINLEKELNDLKSLNYSLKKEEREKIKLLRIEDAKNQAKKIDLTDFNKEISDLHKDLKLQQQNFNKKMAIVIIIILFTSLGTILINKYNIKNTLENIDSKRVNTSNRNQEKLIEDENKERILLENYSVTNKSIKETIKSDDGKVDLFIYDIQYPYIECEEDNQIISYLNNKFKENAKKIYNENLDIVSECIDIYNDIKDEMSGTWSAYTVNSIIDIRYNKNGILSYGIETGIYKGMHTTTERNFYTYDLNNGEEMSIYDIFKKDAKEIKRNMIIEKINSCPEDFYEDALSLLDKELDNIEFYLTEEGLIFYIPEYALAPYSTGLIETEPLDYIENKDIYKDFGQYKLW